MKSSGAAFRALLAETLYDLIYRPTKADPDVWLRPAVKPDGFEYYELVLCYVDDVLCMSHNAMKTMKGIQRSFKLKDDKIEEPDTYFGCRIVEDEYRGRHSLLVHVVGNILQGCCQECRAEANRRRKAVAVQV